jgi:hypothetical protein
MPQIATLSTGAKRYRLTNPSITNESLAARMGVLSGARTNCGFPECCFFEDGGVVAIRTSQKILWVFDQYKRVQNRMEVIG